jgi:hypothetical protein
VVVGAPVVNSEQKEPVDLALNILRKGYPVPTASVNSLPDSLYQAIDGRIWYFPEISNRWSTFGSTSTNDWFALDFGQAHAVSGLKLYLYSDGNIFNTPDSFAIEYQVGDKWLAVKLQEGQPAKLVGNTVNTVVFDKVMTSGIRLNFKHNAKQVAVTEVECF